MRHAHVFGINGSASHGTKGRVPEKDADALRGLGFTIPDNRLVEWTVVTGAPRVLLG